MMKSPVIVDDRLWNYLKLDRALGKDTPKIVPIAFLTLYIKCRNFLIKDSDPIRVYLDEELANILELPPGPCGWTSLISGLAKRRKFVKEHEEHPMVTSINNFFEEIGKEMTKRKLEEREMEILREKWNALGLRKV